MMSLRSNSSSTGASSVASSAPTPSAAGNSGSCCMGAVRTLPDRRPSNQFEIESYRPARPAKQQAFFCVMEADMHSEAMRKERMSRHAADASPPPHLFKATSHDSRPLLLRCHCHQGRGLAGIQPQPCRKLLAGARRCRLKPAKVEWLLCAALCRRPEHIKLLLLVCCAAGHSCHDAHAAFAQAAVLPRVLVGDLRRQARSREWQETQSSRGRKP